MEMLLLGAVGGLIPDALKFSRRRYQRRPTYVRNWWFWFGLAVTVALGVLVVYLRKPADALEAVAFGMAAPMFFRQLVAKDEEEHLSTERTVGLKSAIANLRAWWA